MTIPSKTKDSQEPLRGGQGSKDSSSLPEHLRAPDKAIRHFLDWLVS